MNFKNYNFQIQEYHIIKRNLGKWKFFILLKLILILNSQNLVSSATILNFFNLKDFHTISSHALYHCFNLYIFYFPL